VVDNAVMGSIALINDKGANRWALNDIGVDKDKTNVIALKIKPGSFKSLEKGKDYPPMTQAAKELMASWTGGKGGDKSGKGGKGKTQVAFLERMRQLKNKAFIREQAEMNEMEEAVTNIISENAVGKTSQFQFLVAYTPKAGEALYIKKDLKKRHSKMKALVAAATTRMNRAYSRSRLSIRAKCLGVIASNYAKGGNAANPQTDIDELTKGTGGDYKDIFPHIKTHKPDVTVVLVAADYSVCGYAAAILATKAEEGFVIVNVDCVQARNSIPHEIGHLFGCRHNKDLDNTAGAAHGYMSTKAGAKWTTIMAYPTDTKPNRVLQFSNPNVTYKKEKTGTKTDENCADFHSKQIPNMIKFRAHWK